MGSGAFALGWVGNPTCRPSLCGRDCLIGFHRRLLVCGGKCQLEGFRGGHMCRICITFWITLPRTLSGADRVDLIYHVSKSRFWDATQYQNSYYVFQPVPCWNFYAYILFSFRHQQQMSRRPYAVSCEQLSTDGTNGNGPWLASEHTKRRVHVCNHRTYGYYDK